MKLAIRLALLGLAIAPVVALADNSPTVVTATPGIGDGAIERFTMRFSTPMVPLGDPRAAAPLTVECAVAGEGRWVDPQTYVYDFKTGLPGGTQCSFKLRDGLKSVAGYAYSGQQEFKVDAGGPVARAVLAGNSSDDGIEEDQVFLVAANLPADPASVASNAYCSVEGLGEKIPVEVLKGDTAGELLAQRHPDDNWTVLNFLEESGLPTTVPTKAEDRAKAYAGITALRCRRALPAGHDMALMWGKGIAGGVGLEHLDRDLLAQPLDRAISVARDRGGSCAQIGGDEEHLVLLDAVVGAVAGEHRAGDRAASIDLELLLAGIGVAGDVLQARAQLEAALRAAGQAALEIIDIGLRVDPAALAADGAFDRKGRGGARIAQGHHRRREAQGEAFDRAVAAAGRGHHDE